MTKTTYSVTTLDLQLFAEGADTGSGDATGVTAPAAEVQSGDKASSLAQKTAKGKANPLADVKYGKQSEPAPAAEEQTTTIEAPDLDAEFDELIREKYADQYKKRSSADTQDVVRKRLAKADETVKKYEELSPVLDILCAKYGVKQGDVSALSKAIEDDDAFYEQEAMEKGVSVEQLKEVRKLQKENAAFRAADEQRARQEHATKQYAAWIDQGEEAKKVYPSLDLKTESKNPQFMSLLNAGIDVKTAFEVIHKDEIIPAAMQYAAKTAETKVVNRVMANGARPVENGTRGSSAATVKSDVSKLTKADIAEINRRVARGEKITFG